MLDRTIMCKLAPPLLVRRQYEQWHRAIGMGYPKGSQKTAAGYRFPCWICGVEGVLGVDGFGAKGLIRVRNIQHQECWDSVPDDIKRRWIHTDTKHILKRAQRRKSKRNYNREAIRQRRQACKQ